MKISKYIFILLFLTCSCATILTPKYQRIKLQTNNKSAKVFINDSLVGSGDVISTKVKRDASVKEFKICTIENEDKHISISQAYRPLTYVLSIVPFGILMGLPPLLDNGKKAYNYPKKTSINSYNIKYHKPENSYSISNTTIQFNMAKNDIIKKYCSYKEYVKLNGDISSKKNINSKDLGIYVDENLWKFALDSLLLEKKYLDPNREFLKSKLNLKVIFDSLEYTSIYVAGSLNNMLFTANTKWILTNQYNEIIYTKSTKVKSDLYQQSYTYISSNPYLDPEFKKISRSLFNCGLSILHQDSKFLDAIQIVQEKDFEEPYFITQTKVAQSLEDVVKTTTTIKTNNGHGSGFFIGDNGEIITNYHVVGENDSVKIVKNDGTSILGKVIRKSRKYDLALIETNQKQEIVVSIKKDIEWEFGDEIFVIGTPLSSELSQTVMNGGISGERTKDGITLIQTDASLNSGLSGGPMVNLDGHLIGIVSSKISGELIEGIGFAIYTNELFKGINLKIK